MAFGAGSHRRPWSSGRLGRSGLKVSRLGLGTMTWGRDTDEHEAADQLKAFLEAGGTLVDTAAGYGDGESERVIGRLLGTDGRPGGRRAGHQGRRLPTYRRTGRRHLAQALLDALDGSLQRLGTDHVDLWQVHTWSDETPLEETPQRGRPRGRRPGGRATRASRTSRAGRPGGRRPGSRPRPGRAPLVSTQMEYSLLQRGIEREVLPAAEALGLGVLPWSPLGAGRAHRQVPAGTPADSRAASPHFGRFIEARTSTTGRAGIVDAVATAADGLEAAPLAVALAWVRDAPGVTAPIVGARTAAQLRASLEADG